MSYCNKLKKLKFYKEKEIVLHPRDLSAQYNPDRFNLWKKACEGVKDERYLDLKFSPHVHFLTIYSSGSLLENIYKTPYYKMHKLYGKNDDWIKNKIKSFLSIYEDVKHSGIKEPPTILKSPIEINPYNSSYEIYEGHHRCSIAYFLDIDIKCEVINYENNI